jgi:membrane protein YdbS with pleckstrin-like domain
VSSSGALLTTAGARHYGRHLLPYEEVVAAERRHWARLVEPAASLVGGLIVAVYLDEVLPLNVPIIRDVIWLGWLALVLRLLYRIVEWRSDWFVATNKRVILTYGVLTRKVAMMPLIKVTDMSYNRSPLGRILGYGEFVLESAGQDQALRVISFLPRPDELYEEICMEIFGNEPPPGGGPPPPPGSARAGGWPGPGGAGGGAGGTGWGGPGAGGASDEAGPPGWGPEGWSSTSETTVVPPLPPDPADD